MPLQFKLITTLCYIVNDQAEVLLIKKKRGFGVGKWNGPGGKVKIDEKPLESMIREIKEETGLTVKNSKELGFIEYIWPVSLKSWSTRCYVYFCQEFEGEPKESEEGVPKWFKFSEIPYAQMWDDDQYWYPQVLLGQPIKKRFYFNEKEKVIKQEDI
ncbi:MAG: 8-oxo-dGTP diphosphatase [Patescibacteria group bacterium]